MVLAVVVVVAYEYNCIVAAGVGAGADFVAVIIVFLSILAVIVGFIVATVVASVVTGEHPRRRCKLLGFLALCVSLRST